MLDKLRQSFLNNPVGLFPMLIKAPEAFVFIADEYCQATTKVIGQDSRFWLNRIAAIGKAQWPEKFEILGKEQLEQEIQNFWDEVLDLPVPYQAVVARLLIATHFVCLRGKDFKSLPVSILTAREWMLLELGFPEIEPVQPWLHLCLSPIHPSAISRQQLLFRSLDQDLRECLELTPALNLPWPQLKQELFPALPIHSPVLGNESRLQFVNVANIHEDYSYLRTLKCIKAFPKEQVGEIELNLLLYFDSALQTYELVVAGLSLIPDLKKSIIYTLPEREEYPFIPKRTLTLATLPQMLHLVLICENQLYDVLLDCRN